MTQTRTHNRLLLLDTGIHYHPPAALNHMGSRRSSSALSHTSIASDSQAGSLNQKGKGQGGKGAKSHPAADVILPGKG